MKTLIKASLSFPNLIKRFYSKLFVPVLFLSALLYAFAFRSQEWRNKFQDKIKGIDTTSLFVLILPLIPIAFICLAWLMRTIVVYDVDAPIFLIMVISPILFISGAILSVVRLIKINKDKKLDMTFLFVGAALNIGLLIITLLGITSVQF